MFLIEFQPETLEEDECSRSRDGEEHLGSLMRSHVIFFAPVRARLSTQNVSHSTSITASLFFGCISRVFLSSMWSSGKVFMVSFSEWFVWKVSFVALLSRRRRLFVCGLATCVNVALVIP